MSDAPDKESKTEEPTERRLQEALRKGKGPVSRELPTLLNVCAIWLAFSLLAAGAALHVTLSLRPFLEQPGNWRLAGTADASGILAHAAQQALVAIAPVLALLALLGILASLPQSSGISFERLAPDAQRISPSAGFSRLFGRAGLAHAFKSLLKLLFVALVASAALHDLTGSILSSGGPGAEALPATAADAISKLVAHTLLAFLLIGALDVVLVRFLWRRDLRMTQQEVRDEAKDSEGDRTIKQRMRLLARQRLKKRMIAEVPRATLVIANPTHFAVALRYVPTEGGAPRVVAKGQDLIALKIRAIAEERGIPVVENRWLARALYDSVPVDAYIPPEFYRAVAAIISYLMRQGARRPSP